jgi:hypothetical protein
MKIKSQMRTVVLTSLSVVPGGGRKLLALIVPGNSAAGAQLSRNTVQVDEFHN